MELIGVAVLIYICFIVIALRSIDNSLKSIAASLNKEG